MIKLVMELMLNIASRDKTYYSKILLFGEYLVVKGARAIAIPYDRFSGSFKFAQAESKKSDLSLRDFCDFISHSKILSKSIDTKKFKNEIDNGLIFHSNIPTGHGVGSSGALCASIFDRYKIAGDEQLDDLNYLRDVLSLMESYFHGISSGLDPLVSFINRPIEIVNRNEFSIIWPQNFKLLKNFFLVDTGISRKTAPLVMEFVKLCEKEKFQAPLSEMIQINDELITAFMKDDAARTQVLMQKISYLQYIWLEKMIPKNFRKFWFDALETKEYTVKLCGAGGGGFLLVYTHDISKVPTHQFYPLVQVHAPF